MLKQKFYWLFLIVLLLLGLYYFWDWYSAEYESAQVEVVFTPFKRVAMDRLLETIRKAEKSIDVAMFWLTDPEIMEALAKQAKNGVSVRIIIDENTVAERRFFDRFDKMVKEGVKVFIEKEPGKLHLKCAIIDNKLLITGSANWSSYGFLMNLEDVLFIQSRKIVNSYKNKWNWLYKKAKPWVREEIANRLVYSRTNPGVDPNIDYSRIMGGTEREWSGEIQEKFSIIAKDIESYYTPSRDGQLSSGVGMLVKDIEQSVREIKAAMYYVMDGDVINKLVEAAKRGVEVKVVISEKMLRGPVSKILEMLERNGIKVYLPPLDGGTQQGSMHLKCMTIDDRIVWTGSANWTLNAKELNIEDYIRIENEALAKFYSNYFNALLKISPEYKTTASNR
ncbi:MAG: phospholipase D-like domain-containing protein [Methylacidiphilales bacterium]|nr:phospholipase D-like domain-containing protein [Candidatus Methylacidiphilales bacterium]